MSLTNPLMNITRRAIVPSFSVAPYSFMAPIAVSYFYVARTCFSLIMVRSVLGEPELRRITHGYSEGVFKLITYLLEKT